MVPEILHISLSAFIAVFAQLLKQTRISALLTEHWTAIT
jgi:hypothetical protein